MDSNTILMDNYKTIRWDEISPTVAHANYMTAAPGQHWGWRTIPDLEFILIVDGELTYEAEGIDLKAKSGDVLYIPPGERHVVSNGSASDTARISCLHCEPWRTPYVQGTYRLEPTPDRLTQTRHEPRIQELFRACAKTITAHDPYRMQLLSLTCHELLIRLSAYWRGISPERSCSARIQRCLDYVQIHMDKPLRRAELARVAAVTPEHLSVLCRRELGMTLTQWITREKMHIAAGFLRNDGLSVKETAHRLGFDDPFYFSRVYKRVMGSPPSGVKR